MPGHRPRTNPRHLRRLRLLRELPDSGGHVVWLEAPYGYGKTVLASQWADELESEGWRVVWLSVRGRDLADMLASELGLPRGSAWGAVTDSLWSEPTLLVLEELETLERHEALTPLLHDTRGIVLLASRGPLTNSELPRLVTDGRLTHLGGEALGFSEAEALELFEGDPRARGVWERTSGWPLPLHFALLTGEIPERQRLMEGVRASLSEEEWAEALLLSTVTFFPASAADEVTERLARSGFAQSVQDGYRLHSLVSETLRTAYAHDVRAVLRRESRRLPLVERGEALERLGLVEELASLFEELDDQPWRRAPEEIIRWDELLGPGGATPARHLMVGGALKVVGRTRESAARLRRALLSDEFGPDDRLAALGDLCWVLAGDDPDGARDALREAEGLLDQADPERAGRFLSNAFYVDVVAGDFGAAIGKLERALERYPAESKYRVGTRINLALVRWDHHGDFDGRLKVQTETLPAVRELYPSDWPGQCRDVAMLHWWLGDSLEAERYFRLAVGGARFNPLVGLEARAALARLSGDLAALAGVQEEAEAWADPYTREVVAMHGVEAAGDDFALADRFYERSSQREGLAAAAYALSLWRRGSPGEAVSLIDRDLAQEIARARNVHLRAARYRVTGTLEDLDAFIAVTTAGARLLPGLVPLNELPASRPELALAYPLEQVMRSGFAEAVALRASELPDLELTLMGEFRVRSLGQEVRLTDRHKQLLTLLTLGLSREQVTEALWPETGAEKQRNNIGAQMALLRRAVEPWGVHTYLLEAGLTRYQSDVRRLEGAIEAGDPSTVLDLYREPFAPGVELEAVEEERARLRAQVASFLFDAATGAEPRLASACLSRVVELEPLHERAVQGLIALLVRQGRRHEAGRRYQEFERRLRAETGLAPLAETTALLPAS